MFGFLTNLSGVLVKRGGGLIVFFVTLYCGSAGLGIVLLSALFIVVLEHFFHFFDKRRFTPYLLMFLSPLLLIHYSSITDFRIRALCFLMLTYIITAALTPAAKRLKLSFGKAKLFFIWLTAFAIFAPASVVLYMQGIHLSGDEPHYIMITQSIVEDGDFDLKNNMEEKTYFEYLPVEIRFHGGEYKGKYYSFHTPGVSFLLIPFYWLFGLLGGIVPPQLFFRLAAAFINAFFALGLFMVLEITFPRKRITSFWLFSLLIFPLVFHAVHLYPELPAATLMMFGFIFAFSERKNLLLSGLFLSLIPWFHVKYIPALLFLTLIIIFKQHAAEPSQKVNDPGDHTLPPRKFFEMARRAFRKSFWSHLFTKRWVKEASVKQTCLFFLFPVISLILLMVYSKSLYGSFNPANIFPSEGYFAVPILARVRTLFAYFFDQRDGLLLYAPLFFLAFFGLKRKFPFRGILSWTAVIYILFHANTTLRGAYSPAGRPLIFVSWIFIILIVNFYYTLEERQQGKTLFKLLSGLSIFVLVWLFYYPLFVYQPVFSVTTERASGLLTFFGGSYINLSPLFPSFLSISNWNYPTNYVWLGFFVFLLFLYYVPSLKAPFRRLPKMWEKVVSFLLFLLLAFLLCFYPHIHLIGQNKFSNKKVAFFNNSKNFYYIEGREVFRIKAGNKYDIYFDLKRKGEDRVQFRFLNTDQVDVTVRNGSRLLFQSQEKKEGTFSLRLSKLRKMKVKNKLVAHIGIETAPSASKDNPFLFLKIE